jgi:general secretion pathway protein M
MSRMSVGNRSALALAVGLVLFAAGATSFVISKHVWARDRLAELEPRYARLVGLGESGPVLDAALIERRAFLSRRVYPVSQDVARAGSDALQRARETFSKAGLNVTTTQVLPSKEVEGFDRIPLLFVMDGDLTALQSGLVVMPTQSPEVFIESFKVQSHLPTAEAPQKLNLQVNLFVLRSRK